MIKRINEENKISKDIKYKIRENEKSNNVVSIEKLIGIIQDKYPFSLKVKDIIELTGYSQATVYRMLECGDIPGAKKIRGWRVPRDVFLSWWLADGVSEDEVF